MLPLLISITGFLIHSCGPQTAGVGPISKHFQKTETVSEGEVTALEISGGTAEGTSVDIPAGTLAVGSEVSLSQVDTPSEFDIAEVSEASPAIEVEAFNPDGSAVTSLDSAMTISIPYDGSAALYGLTAVEEVADNLCAVLKGSSGLFVWRRTGITLDSEAGKVSFKSKNLGI